MGRAKVGGGGAAAPFSAPPNIPKTLPLPPPPPPPPQQRLGPKSRCLTHTGQLQCHLAGGLCRLWRLAEAGLAPVLPHPSRGRAALAKASAFAHFTFWTTFSKAPPERAGQLQATAAWLLPLRPNGTLASELVIDGPVWCACQNGQAPWDPGPLVSRLGLDFTPRKATAEGSWDRRGQFRLMAVLHQKCQLALPPGPLPPPGARRKKAAAKPCPPCLQHGGSHVSATGSLGGGGPHSTEPRPLWLPSACFRDQNARARLSDVHRGSRQWP